MTGWPSPSNPLHFRRHFHSERRARCNSPDRHREASNRRGQETSFGQGSLMRYLTRRAAFYLLTAWAALTLNFIIPRLMPGNPVELLIGRFKGRFRRRRQGP